MMPWNRQRLLAAGAALTVVMTVIAFRMVQGPSATMRHRFEEAMQAAHSEDWSTVTAIRRELSSHPDFQSQTTLLLGLRLAADGHLESALRSLNRAAKTPDTAVPALAAAGRILYLMQRYREAIAVLQRVVSLDPRHEDGHRFLASAYYDIGAMNDALNVLEAITKFSPDDFRAYRLRAMILQDFERFDEALIQWNAAIYLSESATVFRVYCQLRKGECLIRLRQYDEAIKTLAAIPAAERDNIVDGLSASEFNAEVLAARSEACLAVRRFEESARFATESLALSCDNIAATLVAVRLAEEQQQFEKAELLLRNAINRHPGEVQLHTRLADVLASSGQSGLASVARARSDELMTLTKQFSDLHQQAIEHPYDAAVRLRLAQAAEKLGRDRIAEMWYRAAAGLAPRDIVVVQALQEFQQRQRASLVDGALR